MSRKMFFSFAITLLVVFIMFLAACAKKNTTEAPPTTAVPNTAVYVPPTTITVKITDVFTVVPTYTHTPTNTPTPTPTDTPTVHPRLPVIPGSVAILVVDDFTNEITTVEGKTPIPTQPEGIVTPTDNCVYTIDGQQGYASSGAQAYASSGAWAVSTTGVITQVLDEHSNHIPHGQLVYNHIRNDLNKYSGIQETPIPFDKFPKLAPDIASTWFEDWKIKDNLEIYLVPVDTSNYKTTAVVDQIQNTIEYISTKYQIQYFVINMSFVIMPCDLGYDDKAPDGKTSTSTLLADYQTLLGDNSEIQGLQKLLHDLASRPNLDADPLARNMLLYGPDLGPARILYFHNKTRTTDWLGEGSNYTRIEKDIFKQWLENPKFNTTRRVINVGAAGNSGKYGYQFPFAPAIWDEVVSVSATGWDPDSGMQFVNGTNYIGAKTNYSNPGEVMHDGQLNYSIFNPHGEEVFYFGTSFAAPEISVEEAFHLLNGGDIRCYNNQWTVELSAPPFGVSKGNGPWENWPFTAAVQNCPNFIRARTP